jgi:hypothetical protein
MTLPNRYELEAEVLPSLRRDILVVDDLAARTALFSLLALVHDLTDEVARLKEAR